MFLRIAAALMALGWLAGAPRCAASSYVVADGVNRAPAVTLHCVGTGSIAVPCGTQAQPIIVAPVAGGTLALPFGGQPVSRSASVPAGQTTQLFPVNAGRHYLGFQVPSASAVWVNFVGGAASANGTDCILLPAGTIYESGQYVVRGAISVYAPVAVNIAAWEG